MGTDENKPIEIVGSPDKAIPKFATNVNFLKLPNDEIVMTFMVGTGSKSNAQATLIETIIVDKDHANQIVETLKKVIEKHD